MRVRDRLAEHLVAAADADERRAGLDARVDGPLESGLAQEEQVLRRVFRAGQDDEVGAAEFRRTAHVGDFDIGLVGERIEIREVRELRQLDDGDVDV